jgi:hypothetical protein
MFKTGKNTTRSQGVHMETYSLTCILMFVVFGMMLVVGASSLNAAEAVDEQWKAEQIADALTAAPPSVTRDAKIYAWTPESEMILVRDGNGPYTCVASGSIEARTGKPVPHPDPMCYDQNAWAFSQAPGPEKEGMPSGLIWMLAGMSAKRGVAQEKIVGEGINEQLAARTADSSESEGEFVRMTPHIMIMPVPIDEHIAGLPTSYDPDHPLRPWIMAVGTPVEHLMVHFSDAAAKAMMEVGKYNNPK